MATGLIPNEGEEDILDVIFATSLVLRLFKSNTTPTDATVLSDLTEADFAGYAALNLTGGAWTTTPGAPSTATYAQQTFTGSGAAQTVYGYYITRTATGRIWLAKRFDSAISISSSTPALKITPSISLKDSQD